MPIENTVVKGEYACYKNEYNFNADTSIFSHFSPNNVFYPIKHRNNLFELFQIVISNCFQFETVWKFVV